MFTKSLRRTQRRFRASLKGLLTTAALQASLGIVVIVPEVRQPYGAVFEQIVAGIRRTGDDVRAIPLASAGPILAGLVRKNGTAVIALGPTAAALTQQLGMDVPTILGAVPGTAPADRTDAVGISLEPDPVRIFAELRTLRPAARTVHVVFQRTNSAWVIARAHLAAERSGIALKAVEVGDIKDAARAFQEIFSRADSRTDAIWLLQDRAVLDDQTLLPYVLEQAWQANIVLVSSNLNHVGRGVLFALYPDNERLGERLGRLAMSALAGEPPPAGIVPIQDLRIAVNQRTASHLGVDLARRRGGYDLVLPNR